MSGFEIGFLFVDRTFVYSNKSFLNRGNNAIIPKGMWCAGNQDRRVIDEIG